jgi:hypothetical protein
MVLMVMVLVEVKDQRNIVNNHYIIIIIEQISYGCEKVTEWMCCAVPRRNLAF